MTATTQAPGELMRPLDPHISLRCVTVATGVTAAVWHAVNAATLPADAIAAILAGLILAAGQLVWALWLAQRPSRRCLVVGAVVTTATLVASAFVLWARARSGPGMGIAQVVGAFMQLTLLLLMLAGMARSASAALLRGATRAGLVCVAVTMSVVVAGGSHAHGRSVDADPEARTTALLCRLI